MASKGAITVKIDPANMNGVIDGLSLLQDRYANVLMKNGATKGARKTLPIASGLDTLVEIEKPLVNTKVAPFVEEVSRPSKVVGLG
jgi:hypothetical protein